MTGLFGSSTGSKLLKLSEDFSYEELLQRLSIDLPSVLPGVVQSSGATKQPAQGSMLTWDNTQQLYVSSPTLGANQGYVWNGSKWVASTVLQASNNLSDVGNTNTARTNIGAAKAGLGFTATPLTGVTAIPSTGVTLMTMTMTVANPAGAYVALRGGMSAYVTTAGDAVNQQYNVDGGSFVQVQHFFFNQASVHAQCGYWEVRIGPLASGVHTFKMAAYTAANSGQFNGDDYAYMTAQELP